MITLKARFEKAEAHCLRRYADEVGEDVSTYIRNAVVLRNEQIDEDRSLGDLVTATANVVSRITFLRVDGYEQLAGTVDFADDILSASIDCKEQRTSNAIRAR